MIYPHPLDLHMHSTVSDGTDTPEEILQNVKKAGLALFALSDHDAIKGCKEMRSLLQEGDPHFIPGAEFSCRDEHGEYHILGYDYDPESEAIRQLVDFGHSLRMRKLVARIDFLKTKFGFSFPEDELQRLYHRDNPGKPHIGNLMVQYGYAKSKEDAIKNYINKISFPKAYLRPEQAIQGIRAAGGVPVLAHPSYGSGDQLIIGEYMERRILRLMDEGLEGLEGFYSGFTTALRDEILSFAEKYSLYVTAGSDYHGRNKMIFLGDTGLTPEMPWPDGLRRFLERVGMAFES